MHRALATPFEDPKAHLILFLNILCAARGDAMATRTQKYEAFRALHERPGAFVTPNPRLLIILRCLNANRHGNDSYCRSRYFKSNYLLDGRSRAHDFRLVLKDFLVVAID